MFVEWQWSTARLAVATRLNGVASLVLTASTIASAEIYTDGTNWFSLGSSL